MGLVFIPRHANTDVAKHELSLARLMEMACTNWCVIMITAGAAGNTITH